MPRIVLDRQTRAARKRARATLGTLRDCQIAPTTFTRYLLAVSYFAHWALTMTGRLADSWDELDLQVMAYMETLWEEGDSKTFAANTLNGIQHLLCTRRVLPGGWKLLRTWDKKELPNRAPPLPSSVLLGMAGFAAREGRIDIAALLLVGFHAMLRTCEFLALSAKNVAINQAGGGVISLPWSKSAQRSGNVEYVTIDDPNVGQRLAAITKHLPPDALLLRGTSTEFRQFFARALRELKVEQHDFRPYSVRRGGASFDFATYGDIKRTMARGRWGGWNVARTYITEGWQVLHHLALSPETNKRIKHYSQFL